VVFEFLEEDAAGWEMIGMKLRDELVETVDMDGAWETVDANEVCALVEVLGGGMRGERGNGGTGEQTCSPSVSRGTW
jgi:hypothetical protein